jgi:septum formation protein
LILASASPRRAELLRNAGISFIVLPPHIPEVLRPGESPEQFVRRMAREKAAAIAMQFPGRWVLGADTAVVIGDTILGKPRDVADAIEMLHLLSGHTHEVSTGVALLGPQVEDIRSESTCVNMSALSELEIRAYVESGEPMDKAGAYAIHPYWA